jgi:hypothetical protein
MNRDYKERVLNDRVLNDKTLTQMLRGLPGRPVPADLRAKLRVLASREQRRAAGTGIAFADRVRLFSRNLMRPLALPFAGGVFSTILLFSLVGPGYSVQASNAFDVPTVLTTEASVRKSAPMAAYNTDDVIVDVTVDGQGRMTDYVIVSGNATKDESLRRRIGAVLLLTEFNPATTLGTPVAGSVRLSFSAIHSHIDVKG